MEAQTTGVETVSVTLGNAVTATQIVNAPLNGRNVLDLALFQPGVVPSEANASANGVGGFSIAGRPAGFGDLYTRWRPEQ